MNEEVEDFKRAAKERKKEKLPSYERGLSSGSTLFNLASTGRVEVGFLPGSYTLLVGESDSGKSFLANNALAEACTNKLYNGYDLIYDGPERGSQMDHEKFYGKAFVKRVRPPSEGGPSHSIEDFYDNLDDALHGDRPVVYVLDSMDCLSSEAEDAKFKQQKSQRRKIRSGKNEEVSGSMTDGKAKKNSSMLRRIMTPLEKTGSILIVINQLRDSMGGGPNSKTFSGGKALAYYAQVQVWTSIRERLKMSVKGKDRHVGNLCKMEVRRSRWTGRRQEVLVPINFSYGIDDTGGMVDWLLEEGAWEKEKQSIVAEGLGLKATREKLLREIEDKDLTGQLRSLVQKTWDEIIEACSLKRKRRYE